MALFKKNQSGSVIAMSILIALGSLLMILSLTQTNISNSHQGTYINAMDRAYRLSETGLNDAIGKIFIAPNSLDTPSFLNPVALNSSEVYMHTAVPGSALAQGGYYIVTSATKTVGGKNFNVRLHSHVKISNAAEYFWAVDNQLIVAQGVNASQGKVYARDLQFIAVGATPVTQVLSAEYSNNVTPLPNDAAYLSGGAVAIADAPHIPEKLDAPLVFPQVLDSDLTRYRELAHMNPLDPNDMSVGHAKCVFTGNIYPPGYEGGKITSGFFPDTYARHTSDNRDHVYYCPGDMSIEGRVIGQVVFVATGTIRITGSIISDSNNLLFPLPTMPGATFASSSTAHQAVLITRKNVIITKDFYDTGVGGQQVQTIEALIMAPQGMLSAEPYTNTATHLNLKLIFTGSMILGAIANNPPYNFATVFDSSTAVPKRIYKYMTSLKTNPPPYLPAVTDIFYSFEEVVSSGGMY
jgi:hypothetical protein